MAEFDVDGDLIRKLADLLSETGLGEIEYADGDRRIRVKQSAPVVVAPQAVAAPAAIDAPAAESRPADAGAPPAGAVTSPIVGTAYLAPEPGKPPFVRVGDSVEEGQTLLIVEAMKVMNPIRAPHAGTVKRVAVQDTQPVEFGELLMVVE